MMIVKRQRYSVSLFLYLPRESLRTLFKLTNCLKLWKEMRLFAVFNFSYKATFDEHFGAEQWGNVFVGECHVRESEDALNQKLMNDW